MKNLQKYRYLFSTTLRKMSWSKIELFIKNKCIEFISNINLIYHLLLDEIQKKFVNILYN
jgi:hypothetical protein